MKNYWVYKNGERVFLPPDGYYGFVYLIGVYTKDEYRFYLGKKAFFHQRRVKVSKKNQKLRGTRKKTEIVEVDSKWNEYLGSSKELHEYINNNKVTEIQKTILMLCKTKMDLTYWETYYLMVHGALFSNECFNSNILGKFYRGKINEN